MTGARKSSDQKAVSENAAYRVTEDARRHARDFNVEDAVDVAIDRLAEQDSNDGATKWDFIPHSDYAFVSVTNDYRVHVGDSKGWGRSLSLDEAISAATALVHAACEARDRAQE